LFVASLKGKRVLVVGLGLQGGGIGVARYFAQHGCIVTVTDIKKHNELSQSVDALSKFPSITFHLDGHREADFLNADLIIKGPSVRWDNALIQIAVKAGIQIAMETALFVKYAPCKTIGITGTRGKSTTTHTIYQVLKKLYTKGQVYMSGNVPGACALELLDIVTVKDVAVLELSSWQLSGFHHEHVSPHIAVFTNIYPDHLNYYPTMVEYEYDKNAIFQYQSNEQVFIDGRKIQSSSHHDHNAQCAKAACIALLGSSYSSSIDELLRMVPGLPMRQQVVGQIGDITIINDSTSTTPIALETALKTFTDKPIILIMGGNAKNLPYRGLISTIQSSTHIRKIYCMPGSFSNEVIDHIHGVLIADFELLVRTAVQTARELNEPSYLLFSPGATSFAQFKNEFDRGTRFNTVISDIIK